MFLVTEAFAMGAGAGAGQDGNPIAAFLPLILMFAIFYFLLIRPQQKKAKEHKALLDNLKRGDTVLTAGGLYGRIEEVKDDILVLDLGDSTVKVGRSFISGIATPEEKKKTKEKK